MNSDAQSNVLPEIIAENASVKPRTDLFWLQYLRAFAALLVVFHHGRAPHGWTENPFENLHIGEAGVDLFFVLSGFIMVHVAAHEPPLQFLKRRFVRIWPMYFLASVVIYGLYHKMWALPGGDFTYFLRTIFFIPYANPLHENHIWPFLVAGWTLNYEMFFYVIFAIGLWRKNLFEYALGIIVALLYGRLFFGAALDNSVFAIPARFYTDPILAEFAFGMVLARLYNNGFIAKYAKYLMALLPLGVLVLLAPSGDMHRIGHWGVGAVLMVMGLLAIQTRAGENKAPWLSKLGDASYCLYLFHPTIEGPMRKIVMALFGTGVPGLLVFLVCFLSSATILALIIHRFVEAPLMALLNARFFPKRAEPTTLKPATRYGAL